MKVSIALCTYNGEKFLPLQLESYLHQIQLPNELIVCDDFSSDNTVSLLKEFAIRAPFTVKIIVNERNIGSTKNFEKSISNCTGDLIFLSDQDDIWLPEKIKVVSDEFEKNSDLGLIFTNAELVDEKSNFLGNHLWDISFPTHDQKKFQFGEELEVLAGNCVITGATVAFKSELRNMFAPIPVHQKLIHDGWIAIIASLTSKVIPLKASLIKYRQHALQQIGTPYKSQESNKNLSDYRHQKIYENAINNCSSKLEILDFVRSSLQTPAFEEFNILFGDTYIRKIDNSYRRITQAKAHYRIRQNLSRKFTKRILPICKEFLNGNYHMFSSGFKSAFRDLVMQVPVE